MTGDGKPKSVAECADQVAAQGMRTSIVKWRRLSLALLVGVLASLFVAVPASANHVVNDGAGTKCSDTKPSVDTEVGTRVAMIVCVTLGGQPLSGHTMEVKVSGPGESSAQTVTTDNEGIARFEVTATGPGQIEVELCDADGCLYGKTTISVTPAPQVTPTPSATPTGAPTPTPTSLATATASATPTAIPVSPPPTGGDEGSLEMWWWLIAIGVVAFLAGLGLRFVVVRGPPAPAAGMTVEEVAGSIIAEDVQEGVQAGRRGKKGA